MEKHLKNFKLIAEIGWNHMGNIDLAEKMIKEAKKSGCNYAKFQNWSVKNLKPGPWDHDGRRKIYEKAELDKNKTEQIYKICKEVGINFLTSIFNSNEIEYVSKINNNIIKIPSPELRNYDLLAASSHNFKEVILSTGASKISEVKKSVKIFDNNKLTLLHCVSIYPCPDEKLNLNRIKKLKEIHKNIGVSDHSTDILSCQFSLAMGIVAIEKHFTIDNNLPGRDNKFALLPKDFIKIRESIDRYNVMISSNKEDYFNDEKEVRELYTGRWGGK